MNFHTLFQPHSQGLISTRCPHPPSPPPAPVTLCVAGDAQLQVGGLHNNVIPANNEK